jgi:hypothetical protein
MLTEQQLDFSRLDNSHKIRQTVIGVRLSFEKAISYSNAVLSGKVVVLANADIYFDETLYRLGDCSALDLHGNVLALLKWVEARPSPSSSSSSSSSDISSSISLHLRSDSQDAWIFQAPLSISPALLSSANFPFGIARCDNRIAAILKKAGHKIINPAFAIHAIEISSGSRLRNLYESKGAALGQGLNVYLTDQHMF